MKFLLQELANASFLFRTILKNQSDYFTILTNSLAEHEKEVLFKLYQEVESFNGRASLLLKRSEYALKLLLNQLTSKGESTPCIDWKKVDLEVVGDEIEEVVIGTKETDSPLDIKFEKIDFPYDQLAKRSKSSSPQLKLSKLNFENRISSILAPLSYRIVSTPKKRPSPNAQELFYSDISSGDLTHSPSDKGSPSASMKERHSYNEKSKSISSLKRRNQKRTGSPCKGDEDPEEEMGMGHHEKNFIKPLSPRRKSFGSIDKTLKSTHRSPNHTEFHTMPHLDSKNLTSILPIRSNPHSHSNSNRNSSSLNINVVPFGDIPFPIEREIPIEKYTHPMLSGISNDYRIEKLTEAAIKELKTDDIEDYYASVFSVQAHYDYIGVPEDSDDHFVISVLEKPVNGSDPPLFDCLRIDKNGTSRFYVSVIMEGKPLVDHILDSLLESTNAKHIYHVENTSFSQDLLELEQKHPQSQSQFQIGVICGVSGQNNPLEMLNTPSENIDDRFWDFMNLMGKSIDLTTHKGFRGDFGISSSAKTFYHSWSGNHKNYEVLYHVAPLLDDESKRRLIGNDIGIIFFLPSGNLDISLLNQLGSMNQIFAVVQPTNDAKYSVAFACNSHMKAFGPDIPLYSISGRLAKLILLTKFLNGIIITKFSHPLNRLYSTPRGHTLENIISKYSEKQQKTQRKQKSLSIEEEIESESGGWIKVTVSKISKKIPGGHEEKEKMSIKKEAALKITDTSIIIVELKTKQKIYQWDLMDIQGCEFSPTDKKIFVLEVAREKISLFTPKASQLLLQITELVAKFRENMNPT